MKEVKGMGFIGVLTLIFVVLKLSGLAEWSWVWVLSPLWLPMVFTVAVIVVLAVAAWMRGR